jgi:hypothetical protein
VQKYDVANGALDERADRGVMLPVAFTLDTYTADVPELDRAAAEQITGLFLPATQDADPQALPRQP